MRAAIVGIGFMGWIHTLAYRRSKFATLVGFASRDAAKRKGDWREIRGNFGPPGEMIDVSELHVASSLDELLADDSIDLIDICLPPHLHVEAIERSLRAGKKVLCEKPLAVDAATADQLTMLADENQLMVAHILPFMPEFRFLLDASTDQRWGRCITARFNRTISPPDWIPDFYDLERVGGPLIDLQVHDAHLARLLFGMPAAAHTACHSLGGVAKRYETVLDYPNFGRELSPDDVPTQTGGVVVTQHGPVVSIGGGVIDSAARGFTHGYEVSFERATVRFEFAAYADGTTDLIPVTVMHNDGTIERPTLGGGDPIDAFAEELDAAATCVLGGPMHPALDPVVAADALRICQMQMPMVQAKSEL